MWNLPQVEQRHVTVCGKRETKHTTAVTTQTAQPVQATVPRERSLVTFTSDEQSQATVLGKRDQSNGS